MGNRDSRPENSAATPLVELTQQGSVGKAESKLGRPPHSSYQYWRSVEPGTPQEYWIVGDFAKRGTLEIAGAAYHDPLDIEQFEKAKYVGISYQISSLTNIDSVAETFKVVVDLNIMFRINDEDKAPYEEFRNRGSITFQDIVDSAEVSRNSHPPIWEIRNAVSTPEWLHERIAAIMQCYDHRAGEWAWYVQLYAQFRCDCYEEFEMENFPFTRNSLQIQLQAKQSFNEIVLIPYNARSAMPHWMLAYNRDKEREVTEMRIRGNTYKCDKTTGNWEVEQHHVAFIPNNISPPMPSGNKFPTAVITIQCKQNWSFYIWNTVPVVFFLPLLTASAVLETYCELADRMSIVLALLLTMATYKVSISSWIPQKDYMTAMDKYIIVGFLFILLQGLFVCTTSIFLKYLSEEGQDSCGGDSAEAATGAPGYFSVQDDMGQKPWVERPITKKTEEIVVVFLGLVWCIAHLYAMTRLDSFYTDWVDILQKENAGLNQIKDNVAKEADMIMGVKFNTGVLPPPPEDEVQQEG